MDGRMNLLKFIIAPLRLAEPIGRHELRPYVWRRILLAAGCASGFDMDSFTYALLDRLEFSF